MRREIEPDKFFLIEFIDGYSIRYNCPNTNIVNEIIWLPKEVYTKDMAERIELLANQVYDLNRIRRDF